jgi:hypothetical protein
MLLNRICSVYGLSEKELLTNYDLFERSLHHVFGGASHKFLTQIKEQILHDVTMNGYSINPNLGINNILNYLRKAETLEFLSRLRTHEHIAFLCTNQTNQRIILSEFFNSVICNRVPKGIVTSKSTTNFSFVKSLLYDELAKAKPQRNEITAKLYDWIDSLFMSSNSEHFSARLVFEDATWWLRNDLIWEYVSFEQSLSGYIQDKNISILCTYDVSDCNYPQLNTIIGSHNYIITDEPFMLYQIVGDKTCSYH